MKILKEEFLGPILVKESEPNLCQIKVAAKEKSVNQTVLYWNESEKTDNQESTFPAFEWQQPTDSKLKRTAFI